MSVIVNKAYSRLRPCIPRQFWESTIGFCPANVPAFPGLWGGGEGEFTLPGALSIVDINWQQSASEPTDFRYRLLSIDYA